MSYIILEMKKLYKNRIIQIMFLFMLFVAVFEPILIIYERHLYPLAFEQFGNQPYQYWILTAGRIGFQVYFMLLFVIPVIYTGFVFFSEKSSSVFEFSVIRSGRKIYFISKVFATFFTAFLSIFLILLINIIIIFVSCPLNAQITEQYKLMVPVKQSFSFIFFQASPFIAAVFYAFINALAIALFAVFVLGMHLIFDFKRMYLAFAVPLISLYAINYISTFLLDLRFSIKRILQPLTASFNDASAAYDVVITYIAFFLLDAIILGIGWRKNRDIL